MTFSLTKPSTLTFAIPDSNYEDNVGGLWVSVGRKASQLLADALDIAATVVGLVALAASSAAVGVTGIAAGLAALLALGLVAAAATILARANTTGEIIAAALGLRDAVIGLFGPAAGLIGKAATVASFAAVGLSISALIAKAIAEDPPDPNYTQQMTIGPAPFDATTEEGRAGNAALMLGDASAVSLVSFERYLGAAEDHATQYEEIQRNAFLANELHVRSAANELSQILPQLATDLHVIGSGPIDALVQLLQSTPLPPDLLSPLAALGISESEFKQGAMDKVNSFPMAASPDDLLFYGSRGLDAASQLPGTLMQGSSVPAPSTLSLVVAAVLCATYSWRRRRT